MDALSRQQDEAEQLRAFFDQSPSGFFIEVGLRGPTDGSRTFALEQAGWTGALVEPQPDLAAFLVTARKANVFACACVAADVAGQPLALRIESPLNAVDIGRPSSAAPSSYVIMVSTRTLNDILRETDAPAPLEFLALDVHGRELDALLGFDFEHWRPGLIAIADPVVTLERHRFLKASGYRLIRRVNGCGWYVPSSVPAKARLWGIVRHYYLAMPFRKLWHAMRRINARMIARAD